MNDAVAPVPDTAPPDQEYAYPPEPPDADPLNVTVLPTVGFGEAEHVPVSWLSERSGKRRHGTDGYFRAYSGARD